MAKIVVIESRLTAAQRRALRRWTERYDAAQLEIGGEYRVECRRGPKLAVWRVFADELPELVTPIVHHAMTAIGTTFAYRVEDDA